MCKYREKSVESGRRTEVIEKIKDVVVQRSERRELEQSERRRRRRRLIGGSDQARGRRRRISGFEIAAETGAEIETQGENAVVTRGGGGGRGGSEGEEL